MTYGITRPPLQCRHNDISNHRHLDCLLKPLFRRRSKKSSKLCVTGLCSGNSPVTNDPLHEKCFHLMTSSCDHKRGIAQQCFCRIQAMEGLTAEEADYIEIQLVGSPNPWSNICCQSGYTIGYGISTKSIQNLFRKFYSGFAKYQNWSRVMMNTQYTGLIQGLHPAKERCHYKETASLIGWV